MLMVLCWHGPESNGLGVCVCVCVCVCVFLRAWFQVFFCMPFMVTNGMFFSLAFHALSFLGSLSRRIGDFARFVFSQQVSFVFWLFGLSFCCDWPNQTREWS